MTVKLSWLKEMASYLRSIDPKHLIAQVRAYVHLTTPVHAHRAVPRAWAGTDPGVRGPCPWTADGHSWPLLLLPPAPRNLRTVVAIFSMFLTGTTSLPFLAPLGCRGLLRIRIWLTGPCCPALPSSCKHSVLPPHPT